MNVGIAGAGSIVPGFLEAQRGIAGLQVKAICASLRSRERLGRLAEDYAIPGIYYDYKAMLADPCLDVIYIAVPNHLHYPFSKWALEQGKSVICEKPFCSGADELGRLAALAEEKGLYLFEAISNQYFPTYQKVRELLPRLGDIKLVELNFSQYSSRYDAFRRGEILPVFDPAQSGGALMDLNVYNIHFILGLFGIPGDVHYFANIEKNIDTSGTLVLKYPGFICTAAAAKDSGAPPRISIQGNGGCIYSDRPSNSFERFFFEARDSRPAEYGLDEEKGRLYYELEAFADMAAASDLLLNRSRLEHSLAVQRILDSARRQAGLAILQL